MLEHRFAQLVSAAAFLLLIIGGTVNPTGSSLACPEPTLFCHGQFFPPMEGGVLYEHGHRQAGMIVGLLQIILTVLLLRRRPELRRLAWILFAMVCVQGALGAFTVAFKLPWFVSTAHLMLAMTYFATLLYTAWRTRPLAGAPAPAFSGRAWVHVGVGAVAIQVILGALVRHSEATLACLDLPACTAGDWFPAALTQRIHMIHRAWGVVTGVVTIAAAVQIYRHAHGWPALRRLMIAAPLLVLAQITLGIYVILTFRHVGVAVAHFAGAAALWGIWGSAWFMTRPRATVVP